MRLNDPVQKDSKVWCSQNLELRKVAWYLKCMSVKGLAELERTELLVSECPIKTKGQDESNLQVFSHFAAII